MKLIATILFILSSIASSFSQEASDSINQKIDEFIMSTIVHQTEMVLRIVF